VLIFSAGEGGGDFLAPAFLLVAQLPQGLSVWHKSMTTA